MKLNKFLSTLSFAALVLAAGSCTDEVKYEPTQSWTGNSVYFAADDTKLAVDLTQDQTSFTIPVHRLGEGELTADIAATAADAEGNEVDNIFALPATVTFAADATTALLNVGVDFNLIEPNAKYTLTFSIDEKFTSPYGASETIVTVSYAPWTEWVAYSTTPYEGEMGAPFTGEPIEGIVGFRKSLIDDNLEQWSFPGPRYNNLYFNYEITIDKSETIVVDGATCYLAKMPLTDTHYLSAEEDGNEYPMIYSDALTFIKDFLAPLNEIDPEDVDDEFIEWAFSRFGLNYSYYNPDQGRFYMNLVPFTEFGSLWKGNTTLLQLPGFADYTLQFSISGNMVDKGGVESVILHSYMSDDLASYTYTISEGALSATELSAAYEALKEDGAAQHYTEKSRNFLFSFDQDKQGAYTLVAIGYTAEGAAVLETSYTFDAVTVQANNPWKVIGEAEYTDCFIYDLYADPTAPADQNIGGETWSVEVEENSETPGLFRLVNPYKNWGALVGYPYGTYADGNYYIVINATDPEHVTIPASRLGLSLNPEDGELMCASLADIFEQQGMSTEEIEEKGVYGTYEDGGIWFPTKTLLATVGSDYPDWYYANVYDFFYVDLGATEPLSAPAKKNLKGAPKLKASGKKVEYSTSDQSVSLLKARRAALANKTRIF